MRGLVRIALALPLLSGGGAAAAQTPLCAWNGTSLTCPTLSPPMPSPGGISTRYDGQTELERLRQGSRAVAEEQAELDRTIAAERRAVEARALLRQRQETLAAAAGCPEPDVLLQSPGEPRPGAAGLQCPPKP